MKIIINLKSQTFKAITNYSKESKKSIDQSIEEVITDSLDSGYEQDYDGLLDEAIKISKTYKKTNASLLQRELKIGYARATRILNKLKEEGFVN